MRDVLAIPLAVVVAAGCGLLLCWAMRWNPQWSAAVTAGLGSTLAAEAGMALMFRARRASHASRAQAALGATLVHLLLCAIVAGVVILARLPLGSAFVYWMLAFYWVTLVVLAALLARQVQQETPQAPGS